MPVSTVTTLEIVIPGYENDFDPLLDIRRRFVQRVQQPHWWDGVLVEVAPTEDAQEVVILGTRSGEQNFKERLNAVTTVPEAPQTHV